MVDNEAMVPVPIPAHMAKVTVTYSGEQGDLPDPIAYDSTDADLKQMITESLRDGYVPGIRAVPDADLTDFVIDRFAACEAVPYSRISCRPKTPFGR